MLDQLLNLAVLAAWAAAFCTVWLLIGAVLAAVVVAPFALFRAWRAARIAALMLASFWTWELTSMLSEGIRFGRR